MHNKSHNLPLMLGLNYAHIFPCRRYKVDLALFGHLHNFERSWPISGDGEVEKQSYENVESPVNSALKMMNSALKMMILH